MSPRTVVLTGASSGIGRAAALAFAARGDRLVLAARGKDDLMSVAAECGGEPLVVPTDVTEREAVDALADAAVARFGRIDVWVDSAAVMAYGKFEDIPPEVFDRVVTTDLLGPANVARTALRRFRTQNTGTLVLCSSLLAHVPVPYVSAYVTAKWGLRGLAHILRQETRDAPDIHVCTVSPGSVDTPIYRAAANYAGFVGRPPPPVDRPDRMAAAILRQADRPCRDISVGATNRIIELGFTLLPPVYDALVTPLMARLGLSREPSTPGTGNVFDVRPRVEGGPARLSRGQTFAAAGAAGLVAAGAVQLGRLLKR